MYLRLKDENGIYFEYNEKYCLNWIALRMTVKGKRINYNKCGSY